MVSQVIGSPPLPDDLLRIVVEECAKVSRETAYQFLFVSSSVMAWSKPHLYTKAILRSPAQAASFVNAVTHELKFCRPAQYIEHLWIFCTDAVNAVQDLHTVLAKCPNLTYLAYDGADAPFLIRSDSELPPRLSRLSVCSPMLWEVPNYIAGLPIPYERITHLHFLCPDGPTYEFVDAHAVHLTSLTHLLFEITSSSDEIPCSIVSLVSKIPTMRNFYKRISTLREIIVKSDLPEPLPSLFRDSLQPSSRDVPPVLFEFAPEQYEEFNLMESIEMFSKGIDNSVAMWHRRACRALEEADKRWNLSS
ncbi:hypothetical protein DFH11DRAFT_414324 [Phellopilus nigrolimitatus]|nr:hypothetical protein DFH11DRAFT_414324 [Phellopilus nigrolimitatus]